MRIRVLSDLHFEFQPDGGAAFLDVLPDVDADLVVVAGDLCDYARIPSSLRLLGIRFNLVAYVLGNHEAYGGSIHDAQKRAQDSAPGNVHVLVRNELHIAGGSLYGCSLWFPYDKARPSQYERGMRDFYQIRDLRESVGEENISDLKFLRSKVDTSSIILTHHLPAYESVDPKYHGSPLNRYFVGGAGDIIVDKNPAVWIHGHTHESIDKVIGSTRIVCNPFGYFNYEVNPRFNPSLVIEVP